MPTRYSQEQIDFVRSVANGRYNDEITRLFNAEFGTDVTENQIRCLKSNHNIQSYVAKRRPREDDGLFTREQIEFINENVKSRTNQNLADLLNRTFGLSVTAKQINTWKKNHGVTSGLDTRFKKGDVPFNKGKPRTWTGGEETRFKKGNKPHNYVPVGSERINADDYVDIKIADPNKWRGKHVLVWESYHGKRVPKGHAVIFGDRNRRNFDPDNLILVSRAQLAIMNKRNLIQEDTDLTRTGALLANVYYKIGQRKDG